ncbi:ABC transporter substrate-binding protein [Nocardioides sp. cx-173]|uniref:ABC transporter substrate-binding protein n=1 Tax=Nocardioides sp. cx-173 TaxID=2898796 RepID=UPI001E3D227D|nr:ABC transporter substrate-binding protein [Nocardioides sp. cx-173]MCD4524516.1 ABC transporter substrate-binding protein [Nocardioides sp. cx-173]UGB42999.1 ABC transporter substrate-binding protein [Nocardioides sp. cx-173]
MPRRQVIACSATSLVLALGLSACGGDDDSPGGSGGEYADGGVFTMALASDPGNLDPSMTPSSVARSMLGLSYDSLVYVKEDGTVVSGLASTWEADATSATFTLKPDITCADGSPFTAQDAADNIAYIADPANQSPLNGVLAHDGITVTADDAAGTVHVESPDPNGFLLAELSGIFMICRAGLDDHESLATATVGTGPWQLDEAVADDHYRFSPTDGYTWGPDDTALEGAGIPDEVNVRIIPSATTAANLLLSGEVNYAAVAGSDAERLDAAKLEAVESVSTAGETWFNHDEGHPGADPAVRKALTVGTDLAELSKVATAGRGRPSEGFITLQPNPCAGGDTVTGNLPDFDADAARAILEDAGWTEGSDGVREKDGTPLTIDFRYDAQGLTARTAGAEFLASQWEDLGVDVDLKALPEAQLNELFFGTGAWDVAWAPFTFNLPSQMVAFVSGPGVADGGANFSNIKNPTYDAAVAKATPQANDAGCADWADAEKALLADLNLVPMFDNVDRSYLNRVELTAPGGQIWGSTVRLLQG